MKKLVSIVLSLTLLVSLFTCVNFSAFANYSKVSEDTITAGDNPQIEIDNAVTEILTAISDLDPYVNLTVSAENGSASVSADANSVTNGVYSILYGNEVTVTALADNGYVFAGWYDSMSNRLVSNASSYTFRITANTELSARFVPENSATVSFKNESGYIKQTVTKTVAEWMTVDSLDDLLPEVPYSIDGENGRWAFDEAKVLAALRNGENVDIIAEYDPINTEKPDISNGDTERGVPQLELAYSYDSDNKVGSFIMAAGIPDGCEIESMGIAFFYGKPADFDPTEFDLTINNKMIVSKFDATNESGYYTVNVRKFTSAYNWAAKGYVTYYDKNGNLMTAYSNQINIIDKQAV